MKTINAVLNWLLKSSADPNEASLAAKGIVLSFVPTAIVGLGLLHVNIGQDTLNTVIDLFFQGVSAVLTLVSVGMALYGMYRKLALTAKGKNVALVAAPSSVQG